MSKYSWKWLEHEYWMTIDEYLTDHTDNGCSKIET